jgi:hypothetical protein
VNIEKPAIFSLEIHIGAKNYKKKSSMANNVKSYKINKINEFSSAIHLIYSTTMTKNQKFNPSHE